MSSNKRDYTTKNFLDGLLEPKTKAEMVEYFQRKQTFDNGTEISSHCGFTLLNWVVNYV